MKSFVQTAKSQNQVKQPASQRLVVQPKLMVNTPGDRYEQEADAMAEKVIRIDKSNSQVNLHGGIIGNSIHRKCDKCEEEEKKKRKVMRKESGGGGFQAPEGFVSELDASRGNGFPLQKTTREFMETAFSKDFSKVRIHTNDAASSMNNSINAKAFTSGSDIYFNQGKYSAGTLEGKQLIAHELTHVVQQQGLQSSIQRECDPSRMSCLESSDDLITGNQSKIGAGYRVPTFDELFNQVSSSKAQPSTNIPTATSSDRKVLLQMEFKPTLDLLFSQHIEAQDRLRRYNLNAFGTGGGTGVLPGFSYGSRRQWGITSLGSRNAALQNVDNTKQALDDVLKAVGLNNASEISTIDSIFLSTFRNKAREIASFMLDQSEYVTKSEYDRYTKIPVNQCSAVIPQLRESAKRLANFQYELVNLMNTTSRIFNAEAPWGYPEGPTNITANDYYKYLGGSVFGSDRQVQSQLRNFRNAIAEEGLKFPVLMKEHLNYIELGYEMTDDQLRNSVIGHAVEVLENIQKSRGNIDNDNIWELKPVLDAAMEVLSLRQGSYGHAFITKFLNDRKRNQTILDIFLSAIGVILAIVAIFATGGLAAFAIVGGTAIGGYQTYKHLEKYQFEKAARKSAFDVSKSIGAQFDPSFLSIAFDVAMTIVGFAQAAAALRGIRAASRATARATSAAINQEATAIERVAANAADLGFNANVNRFASAEGFIAEKISDDIIRITHPEIPGEFILTRQSVRYQTPAGSGMKVDFEVPLVQPKMKPQLQAGTDEVDEALNQSLRGGMNEGLYQTTQRLIRGNAGERLAADALAANGHTILSFKPSILGTNQGGIDIVTIRGGVVHLIDNKALTRAGNISSVSALTTNFPQNLQAVRNELQNALLVQQISASERGVLLQAISAIDNGNYVRVVTNANITRNTQILSGVTSTLDGHGIQFIDVFTLPRNP